MSVEKFSIPMRVLHWSVSLLIFALLAVGFIMGGMEDGANKWQLYGVHKAFGTIALVLIIIRIVTRLFSKVPSPMPGHNAKEILVAKVVAIGLYLSMFSMAFSGFLMSQAHPQAGSISIFGLFDVPQLIDKSEQLAGIANNIHGITAWVLGILIGLHILGAIKNRLGGPEKDVLGRMM